MWTVSRIFLIFLFFYFKLSRLGEKEIEMLAYEFSKCVVFGSYFFRSSKKRCEIVYLANNFKRSKSRKI